MWPQQQPLFSSFGINGGGFNQQNKAAEAVTEFYKEIGEMQKYLEGTKDTSKKELKSIDEQFELTKKHLKEQCGSKQVVRSNSINKPGTNDQPNEYIDWVEKDMKVFISNSCQKAEEKNKEIFKLIIDVHQLMEQYSTEKGKIQKNSSKELQLLNEIDFIKDTLQIQQSQLTELEYTETDQRLAKLRKNARVQDFDRQSYEVLNKLKIDYTQNRILLGKSKFQIEEINQILDKNK